MKKGAGILAAALAAPLLLGMAGCCCGGGHSRGETHSERVYVPAPAAGTPTLGRQLEDLKAAYRRGAISEDEYEIARRRLVEQGEDGTPLGRRP